MDSLGDAIADAAFVAGASARSRSLAWPTVDPRSCAATLLERLSSGNVALVFGPEQSGLTNDDMARCDLLVQIPANPDYSSLNLAMAVQVLCYELRMGMLAAERSARSASALLETPASSAFANASAKPVAPPFPPSSRSSPSAESSAE